jgi:hypothetical protein
MDEELDDLLECEERPRVSVAWLPGPVEGSVTNQVWQSDPNVFFLEADDGEVDALERTDPSLRVELVSAP